MILFLPSKIPKSIRKHPEIQNTSAVIRLTTFLEKPVQRVPSKHQNL